MIEYQRIQFFDSDQVILRNIDHYFFRKDPEPRADVYALISNHAPINSAFMSLRPSVEALIDLMLLLKVGDWNAQEGWNHYGKFTFKSFPVQCSYPSCYSPLIIRFCLNRAAVCRMKCNLSVVLGKKCIQSLSFTLQFLS